MATRRPLDQAGRATGDRHELLTARAVQARDRLEQPPRVRMLGRAEDRVGRSPLDDPPGVHDRDLVGDLGDHAEVVGDDDDRHPQPRLKVVEERQDLRLDGDVERRRRLVGDQQLRLVGERHRDHHALAHAAGELVRDTGRPAATGRESRRARAAPPRGRAPPPSRRHGACAPPRSAACRPCRTDAATTAGPGRSSLCRCRGSCEARRPTAPPDRGPRTGSVPRCPPPGRWVSPSAVIDETVLPEPDSPTIPSVFPISTVYEMPSTACTTPSSVENRTLRSSTSKRGSLTSTALSDRDTRRRCRRRG